MTAKPSPLQQAFHVIRDLEAKVASLTAEPIAVLGAACRLPGGVTSPDELWQLLARGGDATRDVPAERFDVDAFYDPDPAAGKSITRRAGMLDEIDRFDARFFGISPREAMAMDPQQRLLLECTWEALERAGIPPHRLAGSATGVFVAAGATDYLHRHAYGAGPKEMEVYDGTGNAICFAAGRISYLLGAHGPAFTVDTACSSSLLAVHLACQSLRAGECDLAIVAGVSLIVSPETFLFLSRAGNISADGRSRTFDAAASGYGRGEGCGVVLLRRQSSARADGDPILATIRASAVNHDGASSGLTVPSGLAQQAVIRRACQSAAISPADLTYVEAHGTATLLGDPIELEALGEVARDRADQPPLWVGSIKSNLGHLEAAAGIAGLLKVVLMLQHRQIPASLHFTDPNPHADWANLPIAVPTSLTAWTSSGPRLAGCSSFGLSGTNVHVILEEVVPAAPPVEQAEHSGSANEPLFLPLSARSQPALAALAAGYRALLEASPELSLPALARTAALHRSHHEHRLAITGATRADWLAALDAHASAAPHAQLHASAAPISSGKLAFVFSGQGSQWLGMGQELYASSPVFRAALHEASEALAAAHRATAGASVPAFEVAAAFSAGAAPPDLGRGDVVQPLLFASQIALARLYASWGVLPDAVTGHSLGEAAAAHVSGALSLEDAARVVAVRSRLVARISGQGGMLLVELSADALAPHLERHRGQLSLGAVNAPRSTVVSGQLTALDELQRELTEAKVFARRVKIDIASHSPQVEPLLDELRAQLASLQPRASRVPFLSTVTGAPLPGEQLGPDYWAKNLRQPVRFSDAVAALDRLGARTYLEVSPHPVLTTSVEQSVAARRADASTTAAPPSTAPAATSSSARQILASLRRGRAELGALADTLAALYSTGAPVDLARVFAAPQPLVAAPTYPWQRERYWIPLSPAPRTDATLAFSALRGERLPFAGARVPSPGEEHHFVDDVAPTAYPHLADHRIFDEIVVPGAFHLAAVIAAAPALVGAEACVLEAVAFSQALVLPAERAVAVHLTATPRPGEPLKFRRASRADRDGSALPPDGAPWIEHATGRISPLDPIGDATPSTSSRRSGRANHVDRADRISRPDLWTAETIAAAEARLTDERSPDEFYARNTLRGIELGPAFRWITALRTGPDHAGALLEAPASLADPHPVESASAASSTTSGGLHPAQLDAVFQTFAAAVPDDPDSAYVPFSIDRLIVRELPPGPWRCLARFRPGGDPAFLLGDAVVLAEDGRELLRVEGLRLRRISAAALTGAPVWRRWLYRDHWERLTAPSTTIARGARWLLFADERGVAERLAESLRQRGDRCVLAHTGEAFTRLPDDTFHVHPARREDFAQLADALDGQQLDEVVFLWGLDLPRMPTAAGASDATSFRDATSDIAALGPPLDAGARCVTALFHVLSTLPGSPRMSLVTSGAQRADTTDATPGDYVAPRSLQAALLWGAARSLRHERPASGLSRFDLDLDLSATPQDDAARLLAELILVEREDEVLLHRAGRFAGRLVRADAPTPITPSASPSTPLRADACYLITGGLGGLGLRLAERFAAHGATALALLSRRPPHTDEQHAALERLRARGVRVVTLAADAADRSQLAAALAEAQQLAPLAGVVHAAGLVDDATVEQQSIERLDRVLAPKAVAAWHLHQLTRELPLDFFVLFSSAASVLGAPAQSNYAAANAFLDALALERRALGLPAHSLSWGAFSEVGMAAAQENRGARMSHRGVRSISPDEGFDALFTLLNTNSNSIAATVEPHLTVIALEPKRWLDATPYLAGVRRFTSLLPSHQAEASAPSPSKTSNQPRERDALRDATPRERLARVTQLVRREIALVLRLDARTIEPQVPLMSLGFDSLLSLELRNRLEALLGLTLSAVLLWTYPTLDALAEHLSDTLAPPLDDRAASPAPSAASTSAPSPAPASTTTDLDSLTEAEQEALLEARLASLSRRL